MFTSLIGKKLAALVCAVAALTGLLTVAGPAAPALAASRFHPVITDPCRLDHTVDQLDRFGSRRSNVIVWKESALKSRVFHHVVARGEVRGNVCSESSWTHATYHWVVFDGGGTFVRTGDGGYRNWAFHGNWTRGKHERENHVRFYPF